MKHQVAVWPENLILVGGVLIYVIWWKVIQSKHRVGCGTTEMSTQWLFGSDQFIQIVTSSVLDTTGKASRTCLPAFHWKWCVLPHIWNHPNLVGRCWISPSQKYIWYNHPNPVRPTTMCHFANFQRAQSLMTVVLLLLESTKQWQWVVCILDNDWKKTEGEREKERKKKRKKERKKERKKDITMDGWMDGWINRSTNR